MDPWQDPRHVRMEEGQVVVVEEVEVAAAEAEAAVEAQADLLVASFDEALRTYGMPS